MIKKALILTAAFLLALTASAQCFGRFYPACLFDRLDNDTARTAFHMSVGTEVGAGFGRTQSVTWAAPSVKWRVNDRLTVRGGFGVAGSLMPQGYELHGREPRSMAPVRQGTTLGGVWAQAEYRVGERMLVWGNVMRMTGFVQPLWLDRSEPVDMTSVSGGFAYRFSQGSVLAMHFSFVHDHYANLLYPPYGHSYYGPLTPEYELYSGPWPF